MGEREKMYINEAFETNWIAPLGPNVDGFENDIISFTGTGGAVALSSGTAAIHLALILLGVEKGDKVFCSSLTFVASANPILYQGAVPVFIDSEPETWNMSPKALERALREAADDGKLPKAVIVVHLYGQSAKMDELISICNYYSVPIVEDSAESLGSTYKGKASGTLGKFGIFSFNGNKIITTSGGGMLISDDLVLLQRARFLATQARDQAAYYQHSQRGYNYRLSNILAGIGRAQMELIEERVFSRRTIYEKYEKGLGTLPGVYFIKELENTRSNRWLTAITINEKETGVHVSQVLRALEEENIEARPVWKPLHLQPLFNESKYYAHGEDVSARLFQSGICLPSGSSLRDEEQLRVINCIYKTLKEPYITEKVAK